MVAAPLTVFLLKGIASVLNSVFGTLSYTINISIAMIGTLIVFGMLMIAKSRKKIRERVGKRLFWRKKSAKHSEQRCLQFLLWRFFLLFRDFFSWLLILGKLIFCVWWSTFLLLLVWCIFIRKLRPERLLNYWSVNNMLLQMSDVNAVEWLWNKNHTKEK